MKFRATFNERGSERLIKAFLPTLEKFGKACQVLLGPEEVHLIQTPQDADGASVTVRLAVDVLFQPRSYRTVSRHFNLICFSVDLSLLLQALRTGAAYGADHLEVKLTQKTVAISGSTAVEIQPVLRFFARGTCVGLGHDLPISRPGTAAQIDELVASKDVGSLCPYYLDLASAGQRLTAVVERIKALGGVLHVAACKSGDLHIQVAEAGVLLGAQFRRLAVYPQDAHIEAVQQDRQLTAEELLREALDAGEAAAVVKHLLKILTARQLSQPSQILFGIAEGGGHVHVMYIYRNPESTAPFDDSMSMTFKLPVRDEE